MDELDSLKAALENAVTISTGVDFSGKSLKLDSAQDAQPIVDAIIACPNLQYLTLTGNTLGVAAAQAISKALAQHPELVICRFSDMFTGRMKTEIPPALSALGEGMIAAGARLSVLDLSDNAFGPVGVEGLAKLLESDVCCELEELRLNNNGLGITGGKLLATALASRPRRLKIFIAGRNRLENAGATALANVFKNMGTLEEIAMPQNGIYHAGVSALSDAFGHNPRLARLNLNDNTVGEKGAIAIAKVMPKLKNLKSINFGDCLLKSKGAIALAKAFRENGLLLESVDLSHNEIGRDACLEVVDALTVLPDSQDRLSRVVLAGNSLGGPAHKMTMRDRLGIAAAELTDDENSDDENSDEENLTDSSDSEGTDSMEESNASDDGVESEDAVSSMVEIDVTQETSIVNEIHKEVEKFFSEPTEENLKILGPNAAEVIDTHLQAIENPTEFIQAYVEAIFMVSGLKEGASHARVLYSLLLRGAYTKMATHWMLIDQMLKALGLIKPENKNYKIQWYLPGCYTVLASVIDEPYIPRGMRDTLKYFISSKLATLPVVIREVIERHPSLQSNN